MIIVRKFVYNWKLLINECEMITLISYGDRNGNRYIIDQEYIEFIPNKPEISSSGFYNGGNPLKIRISQHQYDELNSIFHQALDNKASHIAKRVKLSGLITFSEKNAMNSCILHPNSKELNEIESELKKIIGNSS